MGSGESPEESNQIKLIVETLRSMDEEARNAE